jgi:hypothetical protein
VVMRSIANRSLAAASALAAAGALALSGGAVGALGSTAHTAGTTTLNDSANLRETSHKGFNLYEGGHASGTIPGSVSLHLDVISTNRVSAQITVNANGGSMSGTATGAYRSNGGTASFSGSLSITHGTGKYSHAHGSGLSFSGTIQRSSGAVSVRVNGKLSD